MGGTKQQGVARKDPPSVHSYGMYLHYIVKNCTLFMYADDHQLSHAAESIKEVEQVLNEEGNKVSQWYHKNLLKGNFSEYQTISFGSKQKNKEL